MSFRNYGKSKLFSLADHCSSFIAATYGKEILFSTFLLLRSLLEHS